MLVIVVIICGDYVLCTLGYVRIHEGNKDCVPLYGVLINACLPMRFLRTILAILLSAFLKRSIINPV